MRFKALPSVVLSVVACSVLPTWTQGKEYERREFGDWVVECMPSDEAECQLYQRILTQDPQVAALAIALHWKHNPGHFEAQIVLPLNVDLRQPARLQIDGNYLIDLPWSRCDRNGCLIEGGIDINLIREILGGQSASVSIFHAYDGEIPIPIFLDGFEEAVRAVIPNDVYSNSLRPEN